MHIIQVQLTKIYFIVTYFKIGLYRILVYSRFSLDRLEKIGYIILISQNDI